MRTTSLRATVLATLALGLPVAAHAQAPTALQPGTVVEGRLDASDMRAGDYLSDSVRVQGQAGIPIRLEVASQVPDTHVVVVSAKGELVLMPTAASSDPARPAQLVFTPTSSGEHFVTVSGKGTGTYALAWPSVATAGTPPAPVAASGAAASGARIANPAARSNHYLAGHANGGSSRKASVSDSGTIGHVDTGGVPLRMLRGVQHFGRLAHLSDQKFIHHSTVASFELSPDGEALSLAYGSWRFRFGPGQRAPGGGTPITQLTVLEAPPKFSKVEAELWGADKHELQLHLSQKGNLSTNSGTTRYTFTPMNGKFEVKQHYRNTGLTFSGRNWRSFGETAYFLPHTAESVAREARAEGAAMARKRAMAADRSRERAAEQAQRDAAFAGFMGALSGASSELQHQADLERTLQGSLDRGLAQGAAIYQQQEAQRRAQEARRTAQLAQQRAIAGSATSVAAAPTASTPPRPARVAPRSSSPSTPSTSTATASSASTPSRAAQSGGTRGKASAAGQPMRFVMKIGLKNLPGDRVNPTCYSNIITRPGPPGWGEGGFLPSGSGAQARETVLSLKARFIAACRQSGRDVTHEGNFNWVSNGSPGDEQKLSTTLPRYREDVSVTLN